MGSPDRSLGMMLGNMGTSPGTVSGLGRGARFKKYYKPQAEMGITDHIRSAMGTAHRLDHGRGVWSSEFTEYSMSDESDANYEFPQTNLQKSEKKSESMVLAQDDPTLDKTKNDPDYFKYMKEIKMNARESPYKSWLNSLPPSLKTSQDISPNNTSGETSSNGDTASTVGIDESSNECSTMSIEKPKRVGGGDEDVNMSSGGAKISRRKMTTAERLEISTKSRQEHGSVNESISQEIVERIAMLNV